MREPLFKNGVLLKDFDNPLEWALEVFVDRGGEYFAFITHTSTKVLRPFPTIGRAEAEKLVEVLQEALDA